MRPRTRWMWLVAAVMLATVASCTDKPDRAPFDNPLDPDEAREDPFQIRLSFEDGAVVVRWAPLHLQISTITSYLVFHAIDVDGPFTAVADVPVSEEFDTEFAHQDYARSAENFYYVAARSGEDFSGTSHVVVMGIRTAPTVELADGGDRTGTRTPVLELRPQPVGTETFELSLDAGFGTSISFDSTQVANGPVVDLGARLSGDIVDLHARVVRGGVPDTVGVSSLLVGLRTMMTPLVRPDSLVTDTLLVLQLSGLQGVTRMRFAGGEDELPSSGWEVPARTDTTIIEFYTLDPDSTRHEVWGEFESDFGFTETRDVVVKSFTTIENQSFALQDSASNSTEVTTQRNVRIVSVVDGAAQMRFSEDVGFSGVAWAPYSAETYFVLSPALGEKRVYGQYRNPFSNVAGATATIILQASP